MPNYTPVRIGPNPPQGLPLLTLTGNELVPMEQPTGAIPPWLTGKQSLSAIATYFGTGGGLINSIVGTAHQIAVSTAAGVATLSFPTNGLVYSPSAAVGLVINAAANSFGIEVISNNAAGTSEGLYIQAGTNNTDLNWYAVNAAGTIVYAQLVGDGGLVLGNISASHSNGNGTIVVQPTNAAPGVYVQGAVLGQASFESALSSGGAFYNATTLSASLTMNSVGANYGTIGNVGTQLWGLGSANNIGPNTGGTGITSLQWGSTGGVLINSPGTLLNALTVTQNQAVAGILSNGSNPEGLRIATTAANGSYAQWYNTNTFVGFIGAAAQEFTGGAVGDFGIACASGQQIVLGVFTTPVVEISNSGTFAMQILTASGGPWALEVTRTDVSSTLHMFNPATTSGNGYWFFAERVDAEGGFTSPSTVTGGALGGGTVNVSGGYYLNGVNQLYNGTFTATFATVGANPTGTAHYSVAGNSVTITWPAVLGAGTAPSTTLSISGIPAALQPTRSQFVPLGSSVVESNAVIPAGGVCFDMLFNASSGTVNIYQSGSANCVAGVGNRGFANAVSTTYQLT